MPSFAAVGPKGTLEIRVPNNFYRDWIHDHYSEELRRAAFSALGDRPSIVFSVRPELNSAGNAALQPKPPQRQKNLNFFAAHSDVQLNTSFTFENFVVGRNGELVQRLGNRYLPILRVEGGASNGIGKQRNGPTGNVQLAFVNQYARFENMTSYYSSGGMEGGGDGFSAPPVDDAPF